MKSYISNKMVNNSNCIEHVLCNVLLCMNYDFSMLFTDSWNMIYKKPDILPIRNRIDIYDENYKQLYENIGKYYGITVDTIPWNPFLSNLGELGKMIDQYEYIALRLKTQYCPWLISIENIEEYHYVLVLGVDETGIQCFDYSSTGIKVLDFYNLQYGAMNFIIFNRTHSLIDGEFYIEDLKYKVHEKKITMSLYNNICSFADELNDKDNIKTELAIGKLIICPFLRKISYIGFGRHNFVYTLASEIFAPFYLENEKCRLEEISKKWLFINKLLAKFSITDNDEVLLRAKKMLIELADEEMVNLEQLERKLHS